jgi:type VI secretion system secreted protein VgrG
MSSSSSSSLALAPTQADYVFGSVEGWDAFTVIRLHEVAEISKLFEVEIILQRAATDGAVDLDGLLDTGATLAIRSRLRFRLVHGIVSEIEELDRTATAFYYRVVLAPSLLRARYRTACRTFQDQSLAEVIAALLENRAPGNSSGAGGLQPMRHAPTAGDAGPDFSAFIEPSASYRLALDDPKFNDKAYRSFLVQYNESDFDFLSRLLEEEGISYYFEHGDAGSILTVTDAVSGSPLLFRSDVIALHASGLQATPNQETIRFLREARRARSRAVRFRQYFPSKPLSSVDAEVKAAPNADTDAEHYEFPCYEGSIAGTPGAQPAKMRLERFEAERHLAEGEGTVRSLEPAVAFSLHDAAGLSDARTLLPVRVEMRAVQVALGAVAGLDEAITGGASSPFVQTRFAVLPATIAFRPALATPRPRIAGVQPAVVTAEEFLPGALPEINANSSGAVRLRFPWDQRPVTPGVPSSRWVRVTHYWAGIGYGALHTPRVGHAVLVSFHDGDPNRPVVVGRMYSDQMPIPYDPSKQPTVSTIKSQSSPDGESGFNEFRFEDLTGKEEIFLHAQRDLNEVVLGSHSTSVGGDQSNSVGGNQSNSVQGSRTHDIQGTEIVHVHGDRTTQFDANESHTTGADRATLICANDRLTVGADRSTQVGVVDSLVTGADRTATIGNNDLLSVAVEREAVIGTNDNLTVGANRSVTVASAEVHECGALFSADVNGAKVVLRPGFAMITNGAGATIVLAGPQIIISAAATLVQTSGGPIDVTAGGPMTLTAGGNINAAAPLIKLNG